MVVFIFSVSIADGVVLDSPDFCVGSVGSVPFHLLCGCEWSCPSITILFLAHHDTYVMSCFPWDTALIILVAQFYPSFFSFTNHSATVSYWMSRNVVTTPAAGFMRGKNRMCYAVTPQQHVHNEWAGRKCYVQCEKDFHRYI